MSTRTILTSAGALALALTSTFANAAQQFETRPAPSPLDAPASPSAHELTAQRTNISIGGRPGAETIDIVTTQAAHLDAILNTIAKVSNREVIGMDFLSRNPQVQASLEGADLRDALRWIGGSVGLQITLRANEIIVSEDLNPYPTQDELFDRAQTHYFLALTDSPNSEFAPRAMWNRARIEDSKPGRASEAATLYDEIATRFPKSELVPTALLDAGRAFGRAGVWEEAAARFDTLAGYGGAHNYSVTARRLLADAYTKVAIGSTNPVVAAEHARRALLVLNALDDADPTEDPSERRARAIIRSRAHSLVGEPVEALKTLDIAARYSNSGPNDPELAELTAWAFDRSERYQDAVKAWLKYGSLVEGTARETAFVRAARAANKGGEHLAAIAIAKSAANEGFAQALAPFEAAAFAALDMEPTRVEMFGDPEKLERGEQLARKGHFEQAADALRPVYDRRINLNEVELQRLALAYGKALGELKRTDEAMLVLRKLTERIHTGSTRREIYLFASEILESAGDIDRAIRALEGQL